jgi:hypothetical protein
LFDLKFLPVGRARCIPKSEPFSSFIGFKSLVVLKAVCLRIAACLGAWLAFLGHWGDLGAFARDLAGLNYLWQNFQKKYKGNPENEEVGLCFLIFIGVCS